MTTSRNRYVVHYVCVGGIVELLSDLLTHALLVKPQENSWMSIAKAQNEGCPLVLKLSSEFTGFNFEKNSLRAIELLEHQGGGKVFEALWMALQTRR